MKPEKKTKNTMPTMKQVNEMITALAEEFDFSEKEARVFLKLPVEVTKPKKEPAAESKPRAELRGCLILPCLSLILTASRPSDRKGRGRVGLP